MEKKKQKGILYTLCFACIMLIDWTRGSQPWHIWAACLNLTGVVMAIVIASHFYWKGQSLKKYMLWLTVWLAGSIAGYFVWRWHPGEVLFLQYVTAALAIGCQGMVGMRIWQEREKLKNSWLGPVLPLSAWTILSVLMLFSRFSELWPIWFLTVFGMFYLVPFSKEEKENLWDGLANGVILGFFLIQIFAYGFRPYDEVRYKGAYSNCNVNALMYLVTYIMVLYRIHSMYWMEKAGEMVSRRTERTVAEDTAMKQRKWIFWKLFYLILAAGLVCFVLFTMTRTAILAVIGLTFFYGVLEVCLKNRKIGQMLRDGATFCICVVLLFPCVYMTIRYLPTILHHPIWWDGEYSEEKVHSFDAYDSEKYVALEEVLQEVLGRFEISYVSETDVSTEIVEALEVIVSVEATDNMENIASAEATDNMENIASAEATDNTENIASAEATDNTEPIVSTETTINSEDIISSESEAGSNLADMESVEETENTSITAAAEALLTEEEKQLLTGDAAQSSSRIRLEIYKRYLRHMNLTGHALEEGYFPITEDYHAWHAQNIFLQVGFYHGIPAGLCFLLLIVTLGIYYLKLAFQGSAKQNILPLLIWLLFIGYGMLECVWYLGQSILFLMYVVPKIWLDYAGKDEVQEK